MRRRRLLVVAAVMAAVAGGTAAPGCASSPSGNAAGGSAAGVELADWRLNCRTDMDCEAGYRCVVPTGAAIRNGVCGTVVDEWGTRLLQKARTVPGCAVRQDCPLPFHCLKVSVLDGLCVK